MKIAFSFFLLIYSRVARRLLGPHDTLPCVLITGGTPDSWAVRHTTVCLDSLTVLLKFLTALLEYLNFFNGIVQSADFPTAKAL